jgi:hypothetical protein
MLTIIAATQSLLLYEQNLILSIFHRKTDRTRPHIGAHPQLELLICNEANYHRQDVLLASLVRPNHIQKHWVIPP